jgi:hypothetical protein
MTDSDRVRCPVCSLYPKLTKDGALRNHHYPWYHSQSGQHCPGSGTQITSLPGQLDLEALCEDSSPPSASS